LPSRFREFVALRKELLDEFSEYPLPLPQLPPKTLLASTDPELLQQRRSMCAARAMCGALCCRHIRQAGRLLGCALQQPRSVSQREHTKVVLRPVIAACWLRFPRCNARVFFWGLQRTLNLFFGCADKLIAEA
jgi:hypothetical protein